MKISNIAFASVAIIGGAPFTSSFSPKVVNVQNYYTTKSSSSSLLFNAPEGSSDDSVESQHEVIDELRNKLGVIRSDDKKKVSKVSLK